MAEWSEDDIKDPPVDAEQARPRHSSLDLDEDDDELAPFIKAIKPEDTTPKPTPPSPADDKEWATKAGFGAELPEAFRGMSRTEFVETINELKQLAANNLNAAAQNPPPPPPAAPPKAEPVFSDEDFGVAGVDYQRFEEKLDRFFNLRAAGLQQSLATLAATNQMLYARMAYPHFAKYEREIVSKAQTKPIGELISGRGWKAAYDETVAAHIDEVRALEQARQTPPPPVERGGGPAGPTSQDTNGDPLALTPRERRVADLLGADPRVYAAGKMIRQAQNG